MPIVGNGALAGGYIITSSAGPLFGMGKSEIGRSGLYDWYKDT
jgi:hypothetical protein